MNDAPGKPGVAPCGHQGIHYTAGYVHCPKCDVLDGVPEHVDPERTGALCTRCGSSNVSAWESWANSPSGQTLWTCHSCGKDFHA